MIAFLCHPYHRGGVTSWMKDVFLEAIRQEINSVFLTVNPQSTFISGGNRPDMVSFIGKNSYVFFDQVGRDFELGTLDYRVSVYRKLIQKHVNLGAIVIPSDDEACWKACCQLSNSYKVIGVLHSDDEAYYDLFRKYAKYLSGAVSVSNRIKNHVADQDEKIPHVVIPCGIPLNEFKVGLKTDNIISWIGRIEEEQKRVTDIPKIAKELKVNFDDWKMHVYGDGGKLQELRSQTTLDNLDNHLFFHGWTSSEILKEKLSFSKILLQTSNYEGMSVAVMEALGSGCKIVSSEVSGVEDLVNDPIAKDIVYIYPVGNNKEAKRLLVNALKNENPNQPLLARELAEKYYSIISCLRAYCEFGKDLDTIRIPYPISFSMKFNTKISTSLALMRHWKYKIIKK